MFRTLVILSRILLRRNLPFSLKIFPYHRWSFDSMETQAKLPPNIAQSKIDSKDNNVASTVAQSPKSTITTSATLAAEGRPETFSNGNNAEDHRRSNLVKALASLAAPVTSILDENGNPLSTNRLKKLLKDRQWEENSEVRKAKRKEKRLEKKARDRAKWATADVAGTSHESKINSSEDFVDDNEEGHDEEPATKKPRLSTPDVSDTAIHPSSTENSILSRRNPSKSSTHSQHTPLPLTIILDCSYDSLMTLVEIKSLSSQITRSYSECNRARYQPSGGLVISSFGDRLKERFDTVFQEHYKAWKKGVARFTDEGFAEVARASKINTGMGSMEGAFTKFAPSTPNRTPINSEKNIDTEKDEKNEANEGEAIYLTSDSPNTLSELSPHGTYIIGGIVDKNRHKGICYKRATEAGIKTAKLPIGEFMQMQSRYVLTTNHVVEILLKWLEGEGWGVAFEKVMPKRKGGKLKENSSGDKIGLTGAHSNHGGDREVGGENGGEKIVDDGGAGVDDVEEVSDTDGGVQVGEINSEGAAEEVKEGDIRDESGKTHPAKDSELISAA